MTAKEMTPEEAIEEVKGKILKRLKEKRKSVWDTEVCADENGFFYTKYHFRIRKEALDEAIKIVEEDI